MLLANGRYNNIVMMRNEELEIKKVSFVFFTIFYVLLIYLFFVKEDYLYIFESVVIYMGFLLFGLLEKRGRIYINVLPLILCLLMVEFHSYFGHFLKAYEESDLFDKILHFYAMFSFTLASYSLMHNSDSVKVSSKPRLLFILTMYGTGLGAVYEILEFLLDIFFHVNAQKGLINTNLDIIADFLGSILAGFLVAYTKIIVYIKRG